MKRAVIALVAATLGGCGLGVTLGAPGEWVPVEAIDGPFAPSVGAAPIAAAPAVDRPLRVVTYNIKDGGVEPEVLAAGILADPDLAQADVILIQEAVAYPDEPVSRIGRLAGALGMGWVYAPSRVFGTGTLGDAILSRYPLVDPAVMNLAVATRKRQRTAIAADIVVGGTALRIIDTHLDTSLNISDRILQLRPAVIDQPVATLVGGDFNTNPYAWQDGVVPVIPASKIADTDQAPLLDSYMAALAFANPTAAQGDTETRYGITSRLDAVYARGVTVTASQVDRAIGLSDHWPVWIDVKIAP
ncbi:MAG: endonuclease/exonuclease/phosphatase family protein [Deltaproteobacteria bacterium]|nr:endonuclease/exonuclease/phosphatase family protein [Deltaproteobacteria bacterium]